MGKLGTIDDVPYSGETGFSLTLDCGDNEDHSYWHDISLRSGMDSSILCPRSLTALVKKWKRCQKVITILSSKMTYNFLEINMFSM